MLINPEALVHGVENSEFTIFNKQCKVQNTVKKLTQVEVAIS